jgi:hypothetical protein
VSVEDLPAHEPGHEATEMAADGDAADAEREEVDQQQTAEPLCQMLITMGAGR